MSFLIVCVLASGLAIAGLIYWYAVGRRRPVQTENETYLCGLCNMVDFPALFSNDLSPRRHVYERYWITSVEPLTGLAEDCRFHSILRDLIKKNGFVVKIPLAKVVISRAPRESDIASIKIYQCVGFHKSRRTRETVPTWAKPKHSSCVIVSTPTATDRMTVDRLLLRENFVPQKETRRAIDINLTKQWIEECTTKHGSTCRPQSIFSPPKEPKSSLRSRILQVFKRRDIIKVDIKPPQTFRLIDVENMCIHTLPYDPRDDDMPMYVSLSYVWGQGESAMLEAKNLGSWGEPGALERVDLPQTIKDAVECTRLLGQRYLWTDRLCIVQDDNEETQNAIQHMHGIYMNAYFTIVAGFGDDCRAGLRGYSAASPWSQSKSFHIRDMNLTLADVDTLRELYLSKWITRGWTFQEAVCSRRLLLLMESSAVVWCAKMIRHQDSWGTSVLPHSNWTRSLTPFSIEPTSLEQKSDEQSLTEAYTRKLEDLLKGYLTRQLGKQVDYLNAFSGILGYLGHGLGQDHHGLPEKIFGDAIAWTSNSIISTGGLGRPSWSWVGWKFAPKDASFHIHHAQPLITFFRADRLKQRIWGPTENDLHSGIRKFGPLEQFAPPEHAELVMCVRLVETLFTRSGRGLAQYFPEDSPREFLNTALKPLQPIDILKSRCLVFATSCATLYMTPSAEEPVDEDMTRWNIQSEGFKEKIASITIHRETAERHRPRPRSKYLVGTFIVIQGQWNSSAETGRYRLMMIETGDEISFRVGVIEEWVDSFRWHNICEGRSRAQRRLVVLG